MNLAIGTKVRWESAAGVKRGTIKNIVLAPAANDKITPWIDVEFLVQISDMYQKIHEDTAKNKKRHS
jgi:hypothetical protein